MTEKATNKGGGEKGLNSLKSNDSTRVLAPAIIIEDCQNVYPHCQYVIPQFKAKKGGNGSFALIYTGD